MKFYNCVKNKIRTWPRRAAVQFLSTACTSQTADKMVTASTSPSCLKWIPLHLNKLKKLSAASEIQKCLAYTADQEDFETLNANQVSWVAESALYFSATMTKFAFQPNSIHFPPYPQTQQVVHWLVIWTSLLLNGGTSAQLPLVNWLVQAVTNGELELHLLELLCLKIYNLTGKTRNYQFS